jgi:undecaprenyl diphosphate synthase
MSKTLTVDNLPIHIAILMDGNRRWAKERGLPIIAGHKKVTEERIEELIERAAELGIAYITFWGFSTENWGRGKNEVTAILRLFRWALEKRAKRLVERGARVRMIGDLSAFPKDIQAGFERMMKESAHNTKITVTFALNYGGRDEMVRAIRKLQVTSYKLQGLDEPFISNLLDTAGMPDPDMIIRPGGEQRLSGFMLWQCAYAELYFTKTLMPDFGKEELDKALEELGRRKRRFGKG